MTQADAGKPRSVRTDMFSIPPEKPMNSPTIPEGLDLIPSPTSGFVIRRRWFSWKVIPIVGFAVVWDILVGAMVVTMFAKPNALPAAIFLMFTHGGVGVFVTYTAISQLLNTTDVEVSPTTVEVRTKPLPWPGNRLLGFASMTEILVRERQRSNRNTTWAVMYADTARKERKLLSGIERKEQAEYIAGMIRAAWESWKDAEPGDTESDGR